jgi:glycosyltransferase involved in cell wall biosynthesis
VIKVLQVNSSDVIGSRFNNFALRELLAANDVRSRHLVWKKHSDDEASVQFFNVPGSKLAVRALDRVERELSLQSRLFPQSFTLPLHRDFREADIVHYHIIHDRFFGLDALPLLTRLRPSIWTWHDPWPMTGHCIYPITCERWRTGCGACPMLDLPFAMRKDRTAKDFAWKQRLFRGMDIDIVVASDHMRQMTQASPIAGQMRVHTIPFGIDLDKFTPTDPRPSRQRLGIRPDRVVIGVRAFPGSPYKGFEYFVEALRRIDDIGTKLTIVTTHEKGQLNEFIGRHQIVDVGWVNDDKVMLDTLHAVDFFVMPSTAEAFGMMAIESMACGKPVIVFDRTSLPEITHAPNVGISVPHGNVDRLADAMRALITNQGERQARGAAGRALAEQRYGDRLFAQRLAALYRDVAARHAGQ